MVEIEKWPGEPEELDNGEFSLEQWLLEQKEHTQSEEDAGKPIA